MSNVEDLQKEEIDRLTHVEVEEVPLEDLLILGTDKLINISITYPEERDGQIILVKTRAKIKQLSLKRLKNIDINNLEFDAVVNILEQALCKQDGTAMSKELILELPVGVCLAVTREIMKISGVNETQLGF